NIRDILAETLINLGFHVLTAEHGVAALSVIKREHVDVMLLDMRMPLKDGLSLLTEIKDMLPSLPVVLITGLASHEEVEEALRIGAFSCIRKPFNIETLKTEVEKALTRDSA
ncbi:MAG: response regulator, partial [Candidatus Hydrogenedentes bacterium]|nr:response regulator [Candidatus Hydrogenedentota bacterium]